MSQSENTKTVSEAQKLTLAPDACVQLLLFVTV